MINLLGAGVVIELARVFVVSEVLLVTQKTQSFDWVFCVLLILIRRVVYKIDKDNFSN
jgi:hypothetical protein